jgi:hypothetical protein
MNQKGQTVIELMLLLAVSVLAISVIYSIYSAQIEASNISKEVSVAKSTINKIVNSANSLALSGAGSTERILIEIPADVNLMDSNISGKEVRFRLSNGSEIYGFADVDVVGEFKKVNGQFVTDGYFVNLFFDGSKVIISFDDFELNTSGIFVSLKQGTGVQKFFTVRNNSLHETVFWIEKEFSFSSDALITIAPSDTYFTLSSGEVKVIYFDVNVSSTSSGNYAGNFNVIGLINNGVSDENISKQIFVSVESILKISPLMIFPKTTSFSSHANSLTVKSFSVCNSNADISSVTWSRKSNPDANMLAWFNFPPRSISGDIVADISANDCVEFDLNFFVPIGAVLKTYDANLTAVSSDGNIASAYFYLTVN